MRYHPVYLDVGGRACTVLGGDEAAERKVAALLEAGARVTVVSATLTPDLAALAETHEIVHHPRGYRRGDLAGATLAYAVGGDDAQQAAIAAEAAETGVWLNVLDRPRLCTFIAPAVVEHGPVTVAISTGGASPALAKHLRREIEGVVGPEYGAAATLLGKLRPIVAATRADAGARAALYAALLASPLLAALKAGDGEAVDAILAETVGGGASLASLGISLRAS